MPPMLEEKNENWTFESQIMNFINRFGMKYSLFEEFYTACFVVISFFI